MFANVFADTQLGSEVLEVILNEPIGKINFIDSQKTFKSNQNAKGVRLDVLMNNDKNYYNLEMQNKTYANLSKRRIYYKSTIISHLLQQGKDYSELPKVNVIFICNFDYFKQNRCIYTLDNSCRENRNLILEDVGVDLFVNIKGYDNAETKAQYHLFKYFCTNIPTDKLTTKIDNKVKKIKSNQIFRSEYMKYALDLQDMIKYENKNAELKKSLEIAQGFIVEGGHDLNYISKMIKLPMEQVIALRDGCSVEDILEQYGNFD